METIKLKPTLINTLWELRKFRLLELINQKRPYKQKECIKEIASLCGVNRKTVQNWCNLEKGEKGDIPLTDALILSKFLGISPEELVEKKTP